MLGQDFADRTIQPAQMQPYHAFTYFGAFHRVSQYEGHATHDLVFDEPTPGRTKGLSNQIYTHALG